MFAPHLAHPRPDLRRVLHKVPLLEHRGCLDLRRS
jgi:hypothetical protein